MQNPATPSPYAERLGETLREPISEEYIARTAAEVFSAHGFNFEKNDDVTTDNHTLLFTISGGVKYEDVLSGHEAPPEHPRQASIQRCVRADGLHKIGYSGRHHIAFDMLGHFNFFELEELNAKVLAIESALELLSRLGVEDIFARHHPDDTISAAILGGHSLTILEDEANIHVCNRKLRSGHRVELGRLVNGTPTEIWNIVFTEFEGVDEARQPLEKIAFDSGASVDRLVAATLGEPTNYSIPTWQRAQQNLGDLEPPVASRIADFSKAAVVMAESGVTPGPKGSHYIARKVFSELVHQKIENPSLDITQVLRDSISAHELDTSADDVVALFEQEWRRVGNVIKNGTKVIAKNMARHGMTPDENDYTTYKQTFGLDRETVDLIIKMELNA